MRPIGPLFMDMTKYENLDPTAQQKGENQPALQSECAGAESMIRLPNIDDMNVDARVFDVLKSRRSLRKFHKRALSFEELAYLLWATQGVQKKMGNRATLRTVPSAGARHAFETFLLVNRIDGLERGLYRYLALENGLVLTDEASDVQERVLSGCLGQGFVSFASAVFIWVADVARMKWRYGQRGYRYLHLDAGHVCQNLYIAAESIDCGACAIAAYDDDQMNDVVGVDGEDQFVIYIATVGPKP